MSGIETLQLVSRWRNTSPPAGLLRRATAEVGKLSRKQILIGAAGLAVAGATCYTGYKLYQQTKVAVQAVQRWWRGPMIMAPAPVIATIDAAVGTFKAETALPGSEEVPLTAPKCQAVVGYEENNKFYVVGNATRIDRWLVIPDHVKAAAAAKQLELRLVGNGKGLGFKLEKAVLDAFVVLDTDLLAAELSEADFSRIGLAKVAVTPSLDEVHGAFVQICGPYGKGTTGNLSHHRIFGKTTYTGSTFEGYSGAPYMAGRFVAAVHLHGGSFNGGYSASYILCLLKHVFGVKDEDTADWLTTYVKDKHNVTWDNGYLDEEDVRVRVGGRYHIIKRDNMARVWGKDWAQGINRSGKKQHYYEDVECKTPGETSGQASPGASSSLTNYRPFVEELVSRQDWIGLQRFASQQEFLRSRAKSTA